MSYTSVVNRKKRDVFRLFPDLGHFYPRFRIFSAFSDKGQSTAIFGPTEFFPAVHACWWVHAKKKENTGFNSKNTKALQKMSPAVADTVEGLCSHKYLYLWHRGSIYILHCLFCVVDAGLDRLLSPVLPMPASYLYSRFLLVRAISCPPNRSPAPSPFPVLRRCRRRGLHRIKNRTK